MVIYGQKCKFWYISCESILLIWYIVNHIVTKVSIHEIYLDMIQSPNIYKGYYLLRVAGGGLLFYGLWCVNVTCKIKQNRTMTTSKFSVLSIKKRCTIYWCHWYAIFDNSIFGIIFNDILNISIFVIYRNVGYKHGTIKRMAMPDSDLIW